VLSTGMYHEADLIVEFWEDSTTTSLLIVPVRSVDPGSVNGGRNKTNEHKTARRLLEGIVLLGRLINGRRLSRRGLVSC
jgi:hypothetical protein